MAKKQDDEPLEGSVPVNDAWTGLLAISLIALAVATGFLAWDWYQYDEEAVARMKLPKLAGTPPKKVEGEVQKADDKKVDEKKADDKKDAAKKDAALRSPPRILAMANFQISESFDVAEFARIPALSVRKSREFRYENCVI